MSIISHWPSGSFTKRNGRQIALIFSGMPAPEGRQRTRTSSSRSLSTESHQKNDGNSMTSWSTATQSPHLKSSGATGAAIEVESVGEETAFIMHLSGRPSGDSGVAFRWAISPECAEELPLCGSVVKSSSSVPLFLTPAIDRASNGLDGTGPERFTKKSLALTDFTTRFLTWHSRLRKTSPTTSRSRECSPYRPCAPVLKCSEKNTQRRGETYRQRKQRRLLHR